jgi:hypothetical protein
LEPRVAHPLNVTGDFYVEDGCCTLCGVPESIAPDLFAWAGGAPKFDHCYVRRQPHSAYEIGQMIGVMGTQELGCVRYRGVDRSIQKRLVAAGEASQCDSLSPWLRVVARVRRWLTA